MLEKEINGGDAFVVARKLFEREGIISVILASSLPTTPESKEMLDQLLRLGVEVLPFGSDETTVAQKIAVADLIVDGIFGTGFCGEIPADLRPLFEQINQAVSAIFCLDIPSGVSALEWYGCRNGAVHGDFTIAFHQVKAGMLYYPAKQYLGELFVTSIGIPEDLGEKVLEDGILIEE